MIRLRAAKRELGHPPQQLHFVEHKVAVRRSARPVGRKTLVGEHIEADPSHRFADRTNLARDFEYHHPVGVGAGHLNDSRFLDLKPNALDIGCQLHLDQIVEGGRVRLR